MRRRNQSWNQNELFCDTSSHLSLWMEGWVEVWAGATGPWSLQTQMEP